MPVFHGASPCCSEMPLSASKQLFFIIFTVLEGFQAIKRRSSDSSALLSRIFLGNNVPRGTLFLIYFQNILSDYCCLFYKIFYPDIICFFFFTFYPVFLRFLYICLYYKFSFVLVFFRRTAIRIVICFCLAMIYFYFCAFFVFPFFGNSRPIYKASLAVLIRINFCMILFSLFCFLLKSVKQQSFMTFLPVFNGIYYQNKAVGFRYFMIYLLYFLLISFLAFRFIF